MCRNNGNNYTALPPLATTIQQYRPDRDATEAEMAALFAEPPFYSAFCRAITTAKKGSAAGVAGLSYNMIKSWPEQCKQVAYDCLVRQWQDKGEKSII